MTKQTRFTVRMEEDMLEMWTYYSISSGYNNLSEFIRDSINGLIREKKKPSKIVVIENKDEDQISTTTQ